MTSGPESDADDRLSPHDVAAPPRTDTARPEAANDVTASVSRPDTGAEDSSDTPAATSGPPADLPPVQRKKRDQPAAWPWLALPPLGITLVAAVGATIGSLAAVATSFVLLGAAAGWVASLTRDPLHALLAFGVPAALLVGVLALSSGASADRFGGHGKDLRGATLSGSDLRGADLRGADLRGADLSRSCLRGARMDGADLKGAIFTGADVSGATVNQDQIRDAINWPTSQPNPSPCA